MYNISLEGELVTSEFVAEMKENHYRKAHGLSDKSLETYRPNQQPWTESVECP